MWCWPQFTSNAFAVISWYHKSKKIFLFEINARAVLAASYDEKSGS